MPRIAAILLRSGISFATLHPLVKLAIWIASVAAVATAVQLVAWAAGSELNVLSGGSARGLLLAIALACLMVIMGADRRPASDYGLAISERWMRHLGWGLLAGVASYAGCCLAIWLLGGFKLATSGEPLTAARVAKALLAGLTALPVATSQQIIFSGYLLSVLRDRLPRAVAILLCAALFAVMYRIDNPAELATVESRRLLVGMFLIATLLALLRLTSGSIILPAGVLAGWIFVRRILQKTAILAPGPVKVMRRTLAPNLDPRQGWLLWGLLAVAIVVCWWWLRRRGEARTALSSDVATNFKRVFPFSNLNMLAPLDVWLPRLAEARFRVGLKYVPRLIAVLAFSTIATILTLPERLLVAVFLRRRAVPDPVFIVGVHRSGTTHLHNLLALDDQFRAPRMHQIMDPHGFLLLGRVLTPLLCMFLPWKRPMDSVRVHAFAPQEEEFAIAGMGRQSPYWSFSFPREVAAYDEYIFIGRLPQQEQQRWSRSYVTFLRKLTLGSRRRPLLKSPYNTGRVDVLARLFPAARFIHIHRHPYDVYRSNMHLAREGFAVFQLQDPDLRDSFATRFLATYRALENAYYAHAGQLPRDRTVDIKFEDLERDAIGQVRTIYAALGLEMSAAFEARLREYVGANAEYRKNSFAALPDETRQQVDEQMAPFFIRWGYPQVPMPASVAAQHSATPRGKAA